MKALTLNPARRSNPIIILTGPAIGANLVTASEPRRRHFSWRKALRVLWRLAFCQKISMAVMFVLVAVMWWHNLTIADTITAQEAVAWDCIYASPWAIVWAVRFTLDDFKKGGQK